MSQDALGYCDQSYGLTYTTYTTPQPEKEESGQDAGVDELTYPTAKRGYSTYTYSTYTTPQPEKEETMSSVESLHVFREYMAEGIPKSLRLYAVQQRALDALRTYDVEQRARDAMRTYDDETEEITQAIPVDETE